MWGLDIYLWLLGSGVRRCNMLLNVITKKYKQVCSEEILTGRTWNCYDAQWKMKRIKQNRNRVEEEKGRGRLRKILRWKWREKRRKTTAETEEKEKRRGTWGTRTGKRPSPTWFTMSVLKNTVHTQMFVDILLAILMTHLVFNFLFVLMTLWSSDFSCSVTSRSKF